jgi:hypothetical protein
MKEWKEDKPIKVNQAQREIFGWDNIDILI